MDAETSLISTTQPVNTSLPELVAPSITFVPNALELIEHHPYRAFIISRANDLALVQRIQEVDIALVKKVLVEFERDQEEAASRSRQKYAVNITLEAAELIKHHPHRVFINSRVTELALAGHFPEVGVTLMREVLIEFERDQEEAASRSNLKPIIDITTGAAELIDRHPYRVFINSRAKELALARHLGEIKVHLVDEVIHSFNQTPVPVSDREHSHWTSVILTSVGGAILSIGGAAVITGLFFWTPAYTNTELLPFYLLALLGIVLITWGADES